MNQASKQDDKVMPALSLSELCSEAADHVARARLSLFDESADADRALQPTLRLTFLQPESRLGLR